MGSALCGVAMAETFRKPKGVFWCFRCRKRLPHDWVVKAPIEPSYYGPSGGLQCSGCGKDCTRMDGMPRFVLERGA